MRTEKQPPKTIDEYISGFPEDIQAILEKIRKTIRKAASEAKEKISYHIPTFTYYGILVHVAAYDKHIGFYPTPSGIEKFKDEISIYDNSKGTVRFSLDKPIPYKLIQKITAFRVKENLEKAETKLKKKSLNMKGKVKR